jgi:hypothetical protein
MLLTDNMLSTDKRKWICKGIEKTSMQLQFKEIIKVHK